MADRSMSGPSDYLAAERTFLAWIRTGLALMGFGFVVARFGLFLQELQVAEHVLAGHSYGLSLWFGTALIAAGVLVNLYSGWQHVRLVRALDRGESWRSRTSTMAGGIALFLALTGLAMTIYLISFHTSAPANPRTSNSRSNNLEDQKESSMAPSSEKGITVAPSNHAADFWQSQGRNAGDARRAQQRSGSAVENSCLGRWPGQNLAVFQHGGVFAAAPRHSSGVAAKYRGSGNPGRQGWRVGSRLASTSV